jgi:hypothetical protein
MNGDPIIPLQLPLSTVNYLLNTLAQRPYGEVNGLVQSLQDQAEAHLKAQEPKPATVAESAAAQP